MPTLDYLTGFNHRATLPNSDSALGATTAGATYSMDTATVRRGGGTSLKILSSGGTSLNFFKSLNGGAAISGVAAVCYVNFSVLPSAGDSLLSVAPSGSPTNGFGIAFDLPSGKACPVTPTGRVQFANFGPVLVTGVWYRLEIGLNLSTTTYTIDCQIAIGDLSATTAAQQTSASQTANPSSMILQAGFQATQTSTIFITDLAASVQSADYPIGPVSVYGYSPQLVGTHNLDAATSTFFFADTSAPPGGATTALTTTESTSYQAIDDLPFDTGTDAVKVTLGGTPAPNTPSVRSVGSWSFTPNNVSTPATLTPGAPAGKAVGDLLLLICESRSIVGTVATPAGWATVANSPVRSGTASGGTIYLFTRIADGTATDTPSPVWSGLGSTGTTGDSSGAGIMAIQNAQAVLDATLVSQDLSAQGATSTITGVTTVTDKSIVVNVAVKQNEASGQTATVTNYTEQSDNSTTSGTGHIVETSSLVKTPLGASGSGTITWSATTSAQVLIASIALKATTSLSQPTNTWYAEYGFVVPEVAVPYAVRAIVAQELDTAVTSTWAAKLADGSNTEDISNGSISTTTKTYVGKTFIGRPAVTQVVGNGASAFGFGDDVSDIYIGTSFVPSVSGTLKPITLYIQKISTPTDNLIAQIWTDSAGQPGSVLGTSAAFAGSSLSGTVTSVVFDPGPVSLDSDTTYWVTLHRTGAADAVNKYSWSGLLGSGSLISGTSAPVWNAPVNNSLHVDLPIAATWTLAALQGTRLRFGYTAAASGDPRLAAAMLEAVFPAPVAEATPLVEAHKSVPFYPRPSRPS